MTWQHSIRRRWAVGLPLTLLFLWAYWPTLCRVVQTWRSDPDYTHGFLVLPIAVAILWRRGWPPVTAASWRDLGGLLLMGLASLLRLLSARYYVPELEVWSIPVWIAGLVWLLAGGSCLRWAAPAIAFLWFAAPLPARIEQTLSIPLQRQATAMSAWTLQVLGQPAVVSGTTILIGTQQLEIEHACSGLRMFMGTAALAVAFLLLTPNHRRQAVLVIALVAPVAIFANVVRIVTTGLLGQWASTSLARQFAHDLSGVVMVLCAVVSFGVIFILVRQTYGALQQQRSSFVRKLAAWPLLLVMIALVGVVVHRSQMRRMEHSLLQTAQICERSGRWDSATTYLEQYLRLAGDDAQVQQRLARAITQTASTPAGQRRAMAVLRKAWETHPDELGFADSLVELAFQLREYDQVIETTEAILAHPLVADPANAAIRRRTARYRAQALYNALNQPDATSAYSWNQVVDALQFARQADPHHVEHAFRLAVLYREQLELPSAEERNLIADQIIEDLALQLPDSAEAWLARYLYRHRYHRPEGADVELNGSIDADLEQAVRLDRCAEQRNVPILIAAAEHFRERGDLQQGLAYFEAARQIDPQDLRPYLAISEILASGQSKNERQRAVEVLEQGLAERGEADARLIFPLIEQLVELGRADEADAYRQRVEEMLPQYSEPTLTTYRVQLLHVDAWRLAKRNQFADAAKLLADGLAPLSRDFVREFPEYVAQSWVNVGQYHRMAGDWRSAAAAYERAASLDEMWQLEYRWVVAEQNESLGNLDEAIQGYEELAEDGDDPVTAWIQAASTSLRQQLLLPTAQRDWTPFLRATAAARPAAADRLDRVVILEAQQLQINGQDQQALALLSDSLTQLPRSPLIRRSLALTQARLGQRQAALETARLVTETGDPTNSILLQAQVLCQLDCLPEAVDLLRSALETETNIAKPVIQLRLAQLEMQSGHWDIARSLLEEASGSAPTDIRIVDTLSYLALCLQDWPLLEKCEAKLRMMEGELGPRWQTSRIEQMLARSSAGDPESAEITQAAELAQNLERLHPQRRSTRIVAGHVAACRGRLWGAVANYEEAWQSDLPSVSLAVDLIGLLNELGQTARAQRYVREVRTYLAASDQVIDPVLLGWPGESAEEAIRLAEAAVARTSRAESALRLGRTLVLTAMPESTKEADRLERAERAFAQAVEWEPNNTRAWAAYFRFLIAVKSDPVGSQQVLTDLAEHQEISPLNRAFVLAQLHESMGNRTRADELFDESCNLIDAQLPVAEQLVVLQRSAQHFAQHEPAKAETCCRRALELDAEAPGAAQILIELLLERGTREAISEAEQLLGAATADVSSGDQVRRLQARVHIAAASQIDDDNRDHEGEAIALLDGIVHKTNEDALRLAELYLKHRRYADALPQLQTTTHDIPLDVDLLTAFLRKHQPQLHSDVRLRHWAEQVYRVFEEQPDAMLTALELQLEAAASSGPQFAPGQEVVAQRTVEQFSRRVLERAASPDARLDALTRILAHLLQSGQASAAVNLADRSADLLPASRAACALISALAVSPAEVLPEQDFQRVIQQVLSDHPRDTELRFCVANLQLMRGDHATAAELFRRCLDDDPDHVGTKNNLALALAFGNPEQVHEAQRLLKKAIQQAGPQPPLMDTLAVLHLRQGAPQNAVDVLLAMLPDAPADGLPLLHLSQAWLELGQIEMARYALSMARNREVDLLPLLPSDRLLLQHLDRQLRF